MGFGIGLLVSVVTLAIGNNVSIPVGLWLGIIFFLIVGVIIIGYDAHKAVPNNHFRMAKASSRQED